MQWSYAVVIATGAESGTSRYFLTLKVVLQGFVYSLFVLTAAFCVLEGRSSSPERLPAIILFYTDTNKM